MSGVPREIGPYRVLGSLGAGAGGQVLRVQDALGRQLALKLLRNAKASERFAREGEVTASLNHPGIVKVHGRGVHGEQPYLVYEYVEGEDLEGCFPRLGRDALLRILVEVAQALGHAHERGVIHRDVKPANVLIGRDGRARVADFGLAQAAGLERLTLSGVLVGTPGYMSPEQATAQRELYGPQTDVWGLGVLLYRALTKTEPFEADSLLQLVAQIASREPTDPRELDPSVSAGLAEVCLRALEKRPARRYADAGAFAADLERALRGESVEGRGPLTGQSRVALAAALGAALCAAAIVGALWLVGSGEPGSGPEPGAAREPEASAVAEGSLDDDLAKVVALCEAGEQEAAEVALSAAGSRADPADLRAGLLRSLARLESPDELEACWALVDTLRQLPAGEPGAAEERVAQLGFQLALQVMRDDQGPDQRPVSDACAERILELLSSLAAAGLRLKDRRLSDAVLNPLALSWVGGIKRPDVYYETLLAATKLDCPLAGDHYYPSEQFSVVKRERDWGRNPRDPWKRFLELRIQRYEEKTRTGNQRLFEALIEPERFAEGWRLGPAQWTDAFTRLFGGTKHFLVDDPRYEVLLERAVAADPGSPYVQQIYARHLRSSGRPLEARTANARGLAAWDEAYSGGNPFRRAVGTRLLRQEIRLHEEVQPEVAREAFLRLRTISPQDVDDVLADHPWLAE